jgi:hypothetical protein
MRAPSHIDFRTAVKMSQQAAFISGVPKLTPLPNYQSQIVDECYSYTSSPEPDLTRFTPELESNGFPFSRGATPQTPNEPFGYHEYLPMVDDLDYLDCPPWSGDGLVPIGLGFAELDMSMSNWTTPEPEEVAQIEQSNMFAQAPEYASSMQMQGRFEASSSSVLEEDWTALQTLAHNNVVPHTRAVPSLCLSDGSSDDSVSSGVLMQGEWTQPQPHNTHINMGNMITSAPYVPKMQVIPSNAPVWEDVFMAGPTPY